MTSARVVIKSNPEDWCVREIATQPVDVDGPHTRFYVEKKNLNTLDVVEQLAASLDVATVEIGYAGRKDKWGVTRQWFSAPVACDWPGIPGTECLEQTRSRKKLRIGELEANEFDITLREVSNLNPDDVLALAAGFPNRFGPQRVSVDNRARAEGWILHRRRRKVSRAQKGWYLSVLRAALFNDVIEHRESVVPLPQVLDGDVLVDGYPSAPLWGRGRSKTRRQALAVEQCALRGSVDVCEALEFAGVSQDRRAMYARPRDLSLVFESDTTWHLSFSLPGGSYATSMLGAVADVVDGSRVG